MKPEIKISTENGYEKINPTIDDIIIAINELNSDSNSFIILDLDETRYCQASMESDDSYHIENKMSIEETYVTKNLVSKLDLLNVFKNIIQNPNRWKSSIEWDLKNIELLENKYRKFANIGFVGLILEIIIMRNINYKGSGIQFKGTDIEVLYAGVVLMLMILPFLIEEIKLNKKKPKSNNFFDNLRHRSNFHNYLYIFLIIYLTILVVIITFTKL